MDTELKEALEGLRNKLEKATEDKLKAANNDNAEKVKSLETNIEGLQKQISEKEDEVKKTDIKVLRDEFEKQMDAMQAEVKKSKKDKWMAKSSFGEVISKGLTDQKDELVKMARSEEHTSELQSRGHLVC